ncbi:MAG: hypothetical protein Q8L07_02485 [Sediminibacterium sp.]|nr:hypothetical protein [Sediminibacterium sp.]MDP3665233.1 hypothetical protein [Sediminibacterium sp.]
MIQRILEATIKKDLFKGKAILLFGPRQSGKSTLIEEVFILRRLSCQTGNSAQMSLDRGLCASRITG